MLILAPNINFPTAFVPIRTLEMEAYSVFPVCGFQVNNSDIKEQNFDYMFW